MPDVRSSIPWDSLLLVYGTLMVPTLFSVLIGINIWLDSREYFELPAFLLSTLIYAFWLSFRRIGAHVIASTTWPLVWIVFALIVVFNPLPVLFRSSRWWLIKKVGKLLVSGTKPVEFTDFWLGDQFCSLVFTLSNLFFVGCAYKEDWNDVWNQCSSSTHWGIPFALGVLPLVVRAVQSVKRYADSRLYTHLINGGKYCSSILYYAFYFTWRHHNRAHDYTLVLFCMFAAFASIYTCAWDLLMDWSFFKHPAQRRFLRKDLAYSTNYYVYYIAIITNILIRFIWVLYIPGGNSDFQLRTFIVSMFEMLRRWQWNFFRLENEHIGNTDQYRVTREVPLPYRLDDVDNDTDDEGDDDDEENFSRRSGWGRRSVRLAPISSDEERPSSREP
ncbi:EXS family-domain-containing protein [Phellopilus nigrolimitatus]|nr:EXS family-domain-containing protein [Phellopilus nigrolimitatus]